MYQELRLDLILDTLRRLQARIHERFPDSGLGRVSTELVQIAEETGPVLERVRRPNLWLRAGVGFMILLLIALPVVLLFYFRALQEDVEGVSSLLQTLESATQDIIFLGVAIYFLVSLEGRLKRKRLLEDLHHLRSIVHIIDMHQLTKDPDQFLMPGHATPSSPRRELTRFELVRYLEYCSEMLSLSSKLAALHVQYVNDPVVLDAVNDIEVLASDLASRIWQKIIILDTNAAARVRAAAGD